VASHVQQQPSNGPTTIVHKRPVVVSHNGSGYSETNMLTFENCKGRPKDGKMIADDGTVLEVNGECTQFEMLRFFGHSVPSRHVCMWFFLEVAGIF
jgi:hypothetical protein